MSKRRVLDVGNCGPDHAALRRMFSMNFGAELLQTHHLADTLEVLKQQPVDLVVINRKLDQDYSDGVEILKRIKEIPEYADLPVMIITNYAEHQAAAVELGAVEGFGKLEINSKETRAKLSAILEADQTKLSK